VASIDQRRVVKTLLDRYSTTYAQEIGIRLQNKSNPLFQLLYSALLLSARIWAGNAVQAAKALIEAGLTTPEKMAQTSWQDRVDVITWHGYKRYDDWKTGFYDQQRRHIGDHPCRAQGRASYPS
jgi:hypothetical protein